jgi:PAT family beta-lactamase induction signal transducer AmpG
MSADAGRRRSALQTYLEPKTLLMLTLGFSSGLPFFLVGATFSYWLRDSNVSLTVIGLVSWISLPYSFKFLWAPILDRVNAPVFGWLGRRRGWMAVAQIAIGTSLILMAATSLRFGLAPLVALGAFAAFGAATQDIVIDAWRIESAENSDELGVLSSAYQFGYRVAILATDALVLILAEHTSWSFSYACFGVAMVIGLGATFWVSEPGRAEKALEAKEKEGSLLTLRGLGDAILGPFIAFFRAHGWIALLMLAAITLYRLPDFVMGQMANPFYHDLGLSKDVVGGVRATVGLIASFIGIATGGFLVLRFGYLRALIVGGILQALSIAAFSALAADHIPDLRIYSAVMGFDSFSTSIAGVALVSYMSSLTSLGYTATQYALLASAYTIVGKLAKGSSGYIVDTMKVTHGLMPAYGIYFIGCGLIGIPAIILFVLLARIHQDRPQTSPA